MNDSSNDPTPQNDPTISDWLGALKSGDSSAATMLWARIQPRLTSLARRRLGASPRATYDEEDLANSVLNALCNGAREGRFERMESREDLWRLLSTILNRKASNRRRYHHARDECGESVLGSLAEERGLAAVGAEQDDAFADVLSVEFQELVALLEPKLQRVALLKLEGFTNEEVAAKLQRAPRTVTRYLDMIREVWSAGV